MIAHPMRQTVWWLRAATIPLIVMGIVGHSEAIAQLSREVRRAEADRIAAISGAIPAAICVFSPDNDEGAGSGVVISPDGFALSNFHVTSPCGDYMRCGMADGRLYDAVIVGIDPTGDVALLQLLGRNDFPVAPLGDSDRVRPGESCFALGNPFALATDFQPTVTSGIISGVNRYQEPADTLIEYTDCLQTDASINPGNSGGPLFNARGELIGINGRCSFEKRGRVNVGVAYAISINQIKNFLGYLHSGRIVDHATAGFTVGSSADQQTLVTNILRSSDAYRRGISIGDEVIAFAGRSIGSANEFKNVLGTLPRGWRVPLIVLRNGNPVSTFVRLEGVHTRDELLAKVQPDLADDGERSEESPSSDPDGSDDPDGESEADDDRKEPSERDGEKPDGRRLEQPDRREGRHRFHRRSTPMPEDVIARYERRRGFANFAYNVMEQQRVFAQITRTHAIGNPDLDWHLNRRHSARGTVAIELTDRSVEAEYATGRLDTYVIPSAPDHGDNPSVLPVLHLWRRLLTNDKPFGSIQYLGRAPYPRVNELLDVLITTFDMWETHFYVSPSTGELIAVEFYPDSEVDPIELQFLDFRATSLGNLPHQIVCRLGDRDLGTFEIDTYRRADRVNVGEVNPR